MRPYRLSLQAEQSLEKIFSWTVQHFGIEQAARYKDQLIRRLHSLSENEMPRGRPCNALLVGRRKSLDLEYYREGRHFIIYRNTPQGVYVLDFVHGSRDLENVLDGLNRYALLQFE